MAGSSRALPAAPASVDDAAKGVDNRSLRELLAAPRGEQSSAEDGVRGRLVELVRRLHEQEGGQFQLHKCQLAPLPRTTGGPSVSSVHARSEADVPVGTVPVVYRW